MALPIKHFFTNEINTEVKIFSNKILQGFDAYNRNGTETAA